MVTSWLLNRGDCEPKTDRIGQHEALTDRCTLQARIALRFVARISEFCLRGGSDSRWVRSGVGTGVALDRSVPRGGPHVPVRDASPRLPVRGIHWVIVGGESGPGARPMRPEWVTQIRDRCRRYAVPFFFKQWGGVNKKRTGRTLDGRTWDEMPCRVSKMETRRLAVCS